MSLNYYIDFSERLLENAKSGKDTSYMRREFYGLSLNSLDSKLDTDELKISFWVNIYNAYRLILAQEQIPFKKLFKFKRIKFSKEILSLNDIEYGILKTTKYKLGNFKFENPFYPDFIKKLALEKKDETITAQLIK